jgi:poly(3-hydroxybutyrate) depolymerase
MFLDETGILLTAGREGFAVVAPMHSGITSIAGEVFPLLVKYMLDKYPALDPERVYVTGYSMGGHATYNCALRIPKSSLRRLPWPCLCKSARERSSAV